MDAAMGKLRNYLSSSGLRQKTVLWFTSGNGGNHSYLFRASAILGRLCRPNFGGLVPFTVADPFQDSGFVFPRLRFVVRVTFFRRCCVSG